MASQAAAQVEIEPAETEPTAEPRVWYLVYTKRDQERIAFENLSRQGYRAYLPLYRRMQRRGGAPYRRESALFPRYLFVHLSTRVDNWSPIRSTRGVTCVVRFGPRYASVPDELIETLRDLEDEVGLHTVPESEAKEGDLVRVAAGPLRGYDAIFQERKGTERVILLMDIVAQHAHITLPASHIRTD